MPKYYEKVYYGGQPKSTSWACGRCVYGEAEHSKDCPLGKVKRKIERIGETIHVQIPRLV